jgi:hypothetical protein
MKELPDRIDQNVKQRKKKKYTLSEIRFRWKKRQDTGSLTPKNSDELRRSDYEKIFREITEV